MNDNTKWIKARGQNVQYTEDTDYVYMRVAKKGKLTDSKSGKTRKLAFGKFAMGITEISEQASFQVSGLVYNDTE